MRPYSDRFPSIRKDILIMLGIWFMLFVLLDVLMTNWLIENSPIGLSGEVNPIGRLMFTHGIWSAFLAKIAVFMAASVSLLKVDSEHGTKNKKIKELVEVVLLILIGISAIAVLLNFSSMMVTVLWRFLVSR